MGSKSLLFSRWMCCSFFFSLVLPADARACSLALRASVAMKNTSPSLATLAPPPVPLARVSRARRRKLHAARPRRHGRQGRGRDAASVRPRPLSWCSSMSCPPPWPRVKADIATLADLRRYNHREQQLHHASSMPAELRAAAAPPAAADAMLDLPKPDDDTAQPPRAPVTAASSRGLALACADVVHRISPRGLILACAPPTGRENC